MTRILFVALAVGLAASVAACTPDGSTNAAGRPDNDAEVFKTEMDAFVRDTLPKLQAQVGGEWTGFQGRFFEKGGNTGQWEYTAEGGTSRPAGSADEVLDKVEAVLIEQGMEITRPDVIADITGRKANIAVQVTRALDADVESISTLRVTFSSYDRLKSSDDFAENAGMTDLLK
ncbi:MAG: hypothetical protein JWN68_3695 [Nocardioides sp.]|jgi:hypothetical protein|uniref:hypothetical protein n=1 Tax=Nocardioides sp. TaxID=35761 RepID=UPI0026086EA9|nr:hypothetical protein [Nocardioides sp.]MCW2835742.1 hypothetical protein [Nocardioides sp.]